MLASFALSAGACGYNTEPRAIIRFDDVRLIGIAFTGYLDALSDVTVVSPEQNCS